MRKLADLYAQNKFLVLLVLLLGYVVGSIILEGSDPKDEVRTTLVSLVLLAAMGCLKVKRFRPTIGIWLGVATFVAGWASVNTALPGLSIASLGFRITFFMVVATALIYQVATSAEVTLGIILGAIDGYLLLGMMGAGAFSIVEISAPGSFNGAGAGLTHPDLVYFSFITMATVGYGDISPVAPVARSLAVLLAVAGQFYIAVLMALLVGKYIGTPR